MFLQVLGGMRGIIGMLWETSLVDPEEVILHASSSWCYVSIVYYYQLVPILRQKCVHSSKFNEALHEIYIVWKAHGEFSTDLL
jgi:hypothetical protein